MRSLQILTNWRLKNHPKENKGIITASEIEEQVGWAFKKDYTGYGCSEPIIESFCAPNALSFWKTSSHWFWVIMEPLNLDIKEASKYLGISWRYLDEIKCKRLDPANKKFVRYINQGKRVLFPVEELRRFNQQLKSEQWQENSWLLSAIY